jgi:hypothetical protein
LAQTGGRSVSAEILSPVSFWSQNHFPCAKPKKQYIIIKNIPFLLGLTEFTKLYIQIKDNPWPYVNLVKLVLNSGISNGEVVELLKIANGYLPRVRVEYDRLKAELNALKAETSNTVRTYQQFCDRNLAFKKREDELQAARIRGQKG